MYDVIRKLSSEIIVIDRYKVGKWGSKKRQIERNIMVECSQKLDILTGNVLADLVYTLSLAQ